MLRFTAECPITVSLAARDIKRKQVSSLVVLGPLFCPISSLTGFFSDRRACLAQVQEASTYAAMLSSPDEFILQLST